MPSTFEPSPPAPKSNAIMKSFTTEFVHSAPPNRRFLIRTLLVGFFACHRDARAQTVLAPPPPAPDQTPSAVQQANEMDVFASPPAQTETQPFTWGALTFRPHPYYQFLYADGLQYSTNLLAHSIIQTVSPGFLLEIGRHWTLDYSPTFSIYSSDHFSDTFGQTVRLQGGTVYNDWILGLVQSYSETDNPSQTTASQTREQTFATALTGSYTINSKLSSDLSLNQKYVTADQFSSYNEWSTLNWLNYQFWPRLNAAVGAGGGYDDEQASPDMTFEQVQGRISWRATERVGFLLHGGVEVRQFLSGGASDLVSPVFDGTIQYRPLDQTRISVTGQRVVSPSYLQDQYTETTGVSADLNQQFLNKFFVDVGGGYQHVKYISTGSASNSSPTGEDNCYFLNAQLGRTFLKRGSFAVVYQLNRDDSTRPGYTFTSHQVGFQIGYAY